MGGPASGESGFGPAPREVTLPPFTPATSTWPLATKATFEQLPAIDGSVAGPVTPRETSIVLFARRSRTKMSVMGSASPAARFVASDSKATQCGSVVTEPSSDGARDAPLASAPLPATLTRCSEPEPFGRLRPSRPFGRDQTKTSVTPFVSPLTRFDASDWNAARRVLRLSPEMVGALEAPFAAAPF